LSVVRIPPTLRAETGGEREVLARGETVRELLDDLMARFPSLRQQIVEEDELAPFVNVYVGGEDVRTRNGLETPVAESDTVILLPAMAGGQSLGHDPAGHGRCQAPDMPRLAVSQEQAPARG
jgi:molybdopterin converting factor small subunit